LVGDTECPDWALARQLADAPNASTRVSENDADNAEWSRPGSPMRAESDAFHPTPKLPSDVRGTV
jgi:hypothetical protein